MPFPPFDLVLVGEKKSLYFQAIFTSMLLAHLKIEYKYYNLNSLHKFCYLILSDQPKWNFNFGFLSVFYVFSCVIADAIFYLFWKFVEKNYNLNWR